LLEGFSTSLDKSSAFNAQSTHDATQGQILSYFGDNIGVAL
jgi:hypothetical protein